MKRMFFLWNTVYICIRTRQYINTTPRLQNKTVQNYFCQNFVRFPPTVKFFGIKMAKRINLCKVQSFYTLPNLCQCTTMLNGDAPYCYITL